MSQDDKLAKTSKVLIWNERFKKWQPSGKSTLVEDEQLIEDLIKILNYWVKEEKKVDFFGSTISPLNSINELTGDGFDRWGVLREASVQITEHKKLWKTSGHEQHLPTYETGLWIIRNNVFKYFKFQIKADGQNWRVPSKIKSLSINYHKDSKAEGVEIEIRTKNDKKK